MSLFFVGERRPKTEQVELTPDWEAALEAVSRREPDEMVAAKGNLTVEQARELRRACRQIEALLLDAIQNDKIKTQAEARDFIQANTEGHFPAAKFIRRLKENVGSDGSSATWSEVVDAAKAEEIG